MFLDERIGPLLGAIASPNGDVHFAVLDQIERNLFSTDAGMPTVAEVRAEIQHCLERLNRVPAEEEGDAANQPPHYQIYLRLRRSGWFEEIRDRFQTLVNFTVGGHHTLSFLRGFQDQTRQSYGASVKTILDNLERCLTDGDVNRARTHGDQLLVAAELADRMARHFRVVISALRQVENEIARRETTEAAVAIFFRNFVAETLVNDWATLKSTGSPFRHRDAILNLCQGALDRGEIRQALAAALCEKGAAKTPEDGEQRAIQLLETIRNAFQSADVLQDRVDRMMIRVQARVNARLRYLDSIDGTSMQEIERLRKVLNDESMDDVLLPLGLVSRQTIYDVETLSKPIERINVAHGPEPLQLPMTAEQLAYQKLKERFESLGFFDPDAIGRFVLKELGARQSLAIEKMPIASAEDLLGVLGFYGLDEQSMNHLREEFGLVVRKTDGIVSNEWFEASALEVDRQEPA